MTYGVFDQTDSGAVQPWLQCGHDCHAIGRPYRDGPVFRKARMTDWSYGSFFFSNQNGSKEDKK